ncbi:2-C-methyl-D-erythritol 4-phosphate cytidylyltransferase [Botrimarina hoheduenensis]|uniref:2-C-methyl-D-erythritol 4-phosphate cytidylyltransferase n=1 Tax=Botrimarina hoheduenensis TaxID=2528000 RepID=A0A5C5WCY9_9BACT|nr:2-C-methyl-D-erythritol 4-phosphate cytidylyltransferase [Botrimarina hoheduenensis]TWT48534.1 2-C-methyl-D-erythritol 4-phosphate cytidylyltransferase [Botrimarina hoheduenensis]
MSRFAVLILAAGQSSRFGDPHYKKPFAPLEGRPVWMHAVDRFKDREDVAEVVVVVAPEDREAFQTKFGANLLFLGVALCEGGALRSDSVRKGLDALSSQATHVAIHDAARPCVTTEDIDRVFAAARQSGAAILASPVVATLKRASSTDPPEVEETVPREGLWAAQTPQVFERDLLNGAYEAGGSPVTDDAQLIERHGHRVVIVEGSSENLKITTQEDLRLAAAILATRSVAKPQKPSHPFEDDDLWR